MISRVSGLKGVSSVAISLTTTGTAIESENARKVEAQERPYTVRLYFAEPDDMSPGQRIFDVSLQEKKLLSDFDVVKEAGGANRAVVKEFKGIPVKDDLVLAFGPSQAASSGATLISGIEIRAEGW